MFFGGGKISIRRQFFQEVTYEGKRKQGQRNPLWQKAALSLPALCILWVGPTRIYLGEYWTTDVLGDICLGWITGVAPAAVSLLPQQEYAGEAVANGFIAGYSLLAFFAREPGESKIPLPASWNLQKGLSRVVRTGIRSDMPLQPYYQQLQDQYQTFMDHHKRLQNRYRALVNHHDLLEKLYGTLINHRYRLQDQHQLLEDYHRALQDHDRMGQEYLQALQQLPRDKA